MAKSQDLAQTHELLADEEVVARILAGESELFEILMRRYNQRIFRVARSILGDAPEAEDVMQETYVRAYTQLGQLRDFRRLPAWLTRIAVHEARARRRRRGRFVGLANVLEMDRDGRLATGRGARTPEQRAGNSELRELLTTAIDRLSESHRLVFVLREVEGLSTADAAASLDISTDSVRVRLHRARNALRHEIERRLGGLVPDLLAFHAPRCDRVVEAVLKRIRDSAEG